MNATISEAQAAAEKAAIECAQETTENYMMPESDDPAFQEEYARAKKRRDMALRKIMVTISRLNEAKEAHNAAMCDIFMMDMGLKLGRSVLLLGDEGTMYPFILDHIILIEGYEEERYATWGRLISPETGEEVPEGERRICSFSKHIGRALPFSYFHDVESFLKLSKSGKIKV